MPGNDGGEGKPGVQVLSFIILPRQHEAFWKLRINPRLTYLVPMNSNTIGRVLIILGRARP